MRKKNSNQQYARALYVVTQDLSTGKLSQVLEKIVSILVREHRLHQSDKIIQEFIRYAKQQKGIIEIEITSARKLDSQILAKIKKVFGGKVEEKENLDASLIGGVKIKLADKIFDASLKTQLIKFKQKIVN